MTPRLGFHLFNTPQMIKQPNKNRNLFGTNHYLPFTRSRISTEISLLRKQSSISKLNNKTLNYLDSTSLNLS